MRSSYKRFGREKKKISKRIIHVLQSIDNRNAINILAESSFARIHVIGTSEGYNIDI